ncbi:hypothetical protein FJY90_02045 [Candidatus Gottesmanbacteria bacterium]|nr:hypothetical protein [Candidatus Gottesmanbacteria bacterium]
MFYQQTSEAVIKQLRTDATTGLSRQEAAHTDIKYGYHFNLEFRG